jgi:hypothetical protein
MGAFELLATVVTSNAVVGLIQYLLTRHFNKKDMTQKTLAAVTYSTLADKLERALDRGYATPEQRRDIKVLYDCYKEHGWNGDMDSRMSKVFNLPTKDLKREREV